METLMFSCSVVFILAGILVIYGAVSDRISEREMRAFRKVNDLSPRKKQHWIDAAQERMKRNADQNYDWRKE